MGPFLGIGILAIIIGGLFISRKAGASGNTGDDLDIIKTNVDKLPMTDTRPRGIRNNNPGNLEYHAGIAWRGQVGTDGRYAVFDTSVNGIRAMMINLHTYMRRDGVNTVREIITRWAPHGENPTEAYIQFVARKVGASAEQPLLWESNVIALAQAISEFENGGVFYTESVFNSALKATGKL
jgi:hypothetical protein